MERIDIAYHVVTHINHHKVAETLVGLQRDLDKNVLDDESVGGYSSVSTVACAPTSDDEPSLIDITEDFDEFYQIVTVDAGTQVEPALFARSVAKVIVSVLDTSAGPACASATQTSTLSRSAPTKGIGQGKGTAKSPLSVLPRDVLPSPPEVPVDDVRVDSQYNPPERCVYDADFLSTSPDALSVFRAYAMKWRAGLARDQ